MSNPSIIGFRTPAAKGAIVIGSIATETILSHTPLAQYPTNFVMRYRCIPLCRPMITPMTRLRFRHFDRVIHSPIYSLW
jgi:hypothetical protein